jgi:hypothetical protein
MRQNFSSAALASKAVAQLATDIKKDRRAKALTYLEITATLLYQATGLARLWQPYASNPLVCRARERFKPGSRPRRRNDPKASEGMASIQVAIVSIGETICFVISRA